MRLVCAVLVCLMVTAGPWGRGPAAQETSSGLDDARLPARARLDLKALDAAYPGLLAGVRIEGGTIVVDTRSGKSFLYDDGRVKTVEEALDDPDLEDMLAQVYPLGPLGEEPLPGWHPGRRRVMAFFEEVYGHTPAEVSAGNRPVRFLDRTVPFNSRNGAADALERVSARLHKLIEHDPGLKTALYPVVGTFNWRRIAGTSRLSMHSLAIAIDLNPGRNPYWRHHRRPSDKLARRQSFPEEVVAAFEAEGFIWGGKWAEYDIMHFEFRPELLVKARVLRGDRSDFDEGAKFDKSGHDAQ